MVRVLVQVITWMDVMTILHTGPGTRLMAPEPYRTHMQMQLWTPELAGCIAELLDCLLAWYQDTTREVYISPHSLVDLCFACRCITQDHMQCKKHSTMCTVPYAVVR
jgi:hypothetical protein